MKLFCEKQGAGPALVMAHGVFGSHENLGSIARLLNDNFTLYRVDLRNHGRSPHAPTMSYAAMAADIVELLDFYELPSARVFGHSLGGKVMMELATSHPERVSHLIVADIAPVQYPSHHDPILQGLQSIHLDELASRGEADEQLKPFVENMLTRQFLLKNLQRDSNGHFYWRLNLNAIAEQYGMLRLAVGEGKVFDGPALFLRGELSKYIQDRNFDAIYQRFPKAIIETIPNTTHWLHAEKPQELVERMLAFFDTYP